MQWIAPGLLCDHPVWRELLGFESTEREEELIESVRQYKVLRPLSITGEDCASPSGTILEGHRVRRAAMDARVAVVPVIRRTNLTADAEAEIIVKAALASQHTRRLPQSKIYALEEQLHQLYARRGKGCRSDLGTSVGANGGSPPKGDSLTLVATETSAPRNAIANRRKVFASPVAPELLRKAVDAGTISLTRAATLVREAEGAHLNGEAIPNVTNEARIGVARAGLEEQVRSELNKPPRKTRPPRKGPKRSTSYVLPRDGTPVTKRLGRSISIVRVVGVTATEVFVEETEGSPNHTGDAPCSTKDPSAVTDAG